MTRCSPKHRTRAWTAGLDAAILGLLIMWSVAGSSCHCVNSCMECRPILDGLPSYELGEEEYAAKEAGDTWVQHLLAVLGQCLKWLAPMLTSDNHDSLVACVLDKVR